MISLYMDSVFAEGGTPDVRPLHTIPPTIAQLYLLAMREHEREVAIRCDSARSAEWQRIPDWRLDRSTIRLGLYFQERTGLEPGDRVAVLSELRPEWVVSDLAALASAAVSFGIDPELPDAAIRDLLAEIQPRVLLASAEQLARIDIDGGPTSWAEHVISFDPPNGERVASLSAAIDLGGTLDTPERAGAFRERARELAPDAPALRHHQSRGGVPHPTPRDTQPARGASLTPDVRRVGGTPETHELTQSAAIDLLRPLWSERPAVPGDIALVAGPGVDFATRLALHTFVGDGRTCVALGDGDRLTDEAAAIRPHKIIAPPAALERVAEQLPQAEHDHGAGGGGSTGIITLLRALTRAAEDGRRTPTSAALGGRIRWIAATRPPDPALMARLGRWADVGVLLP